MKKLGIVAIVLVAAALLALPPVIGGSAQTQFETRIATINANELMAVDVVFYDRGAYTSRAVLEIGLSPAYVARLEELSGPEGLPPGLGLLADNDVTVVVDMAHGPVGLAEGLFFGLNRVHAYPDPDASGNQALARQLGMDSLFDFRGDVGYGGTLDYEAEISAIDYADEMSAFGTSAWMLTGRFDGTRIVSDTRLDSLFYSLGPIGMTLRDLRGIGDNEFLTTNIALGTYDIDIASATVVNELDPTVPLFDATGVGFHSDVGLDGEAGLIDGAIEYLVASAQAGRDTTIADGRMRLAVTQLDAAALEEYIEVANGYATAPPTDPDAALAELSPIVERLLAAGPTMSVEPLSGSVDGEPFETNVRVTTDAAALPEGMPLDLQDPSLWLGLVGVDADARVSKVLAETLAVQAVSMQLASSGMPADQAEQMARAQAGFMLVTLVGQGMLVEDGETYVAELDFEDGALTLNGNPLPVGPFGGP